MRYEQGIDKSSVFGLFAGLMCVVLAVLLVLAVLDLDREVTGLASDVEELMHESGVEHPVTAVLLNFRSYDTWLELGVLILGLMGIYGLRGGTRLKDAPLLPGGQPLVQWLIRLLIPLIIIIGGYLLWLGKFDSGGAFQSGVILATVAVLLWLAGKPSLEIVPEFLLRLLVLSGFMAFLVLAFLTLLAGTAMLTYPAGLAGPLILAVEIFATISIAVILATMLMAIQPVRERGGSP
jgi:multisubunit Na+/H+ antiporter MnhB subunit